MATFMSSAFTAPDRRKKVVTYGKSSRLTPTTQPAHNNDATSPERSRKHTLVPSASLKKKSVAGAGVSLGHARADTASPDIFDVPSEDDFALPSSKPAKRLLTKRRKPYEDHDGQVSPGSATGQSLQPSRTSHALRMPDTANSADLTAKKPQKPLAPSARTTASPSIPDDAIPPRARRGKTPQPTQEHKHGSQRGQTTTHVAAAAKAKDNARATTPALSVTSSTLKSAKTIAIPPARAVSANVAPRPAQEHDIFDVPSSGDESHLPTPKPPRRAPIAGRNQQAKIAEAVRETPGKEWTESEDSEAMRKRKRKGSASSLTAPKLTGAHAQGSSLPRKQQKKENSVPLGHTAPQLPIATAAAIAQPALSSINKPQRTRVRTVPVVIRAPMAKGQSSPATLHKMLPQLQAPKPSPIAEEPDVSVLEDDTMYEIPDSLSTPNRTSTKPASGSVTPRQKALFGSLLGTSSMSTTPMPRISRLQLTDRKPSSLLGALSRSQSDLTHAVHSKKVRLLAKLKTEEESSEEEASESESGSGIELGECEDSSTNKHTAKPAFGTGVGLRSPPNAALDDMTLDVDGDAAADSQTSQTTSGLGVRPKFTYAKSRSYLQEANPEDALLMSMDLDDPITCLQTKDSQTEEEDEASQVRPTHELRRQGQNSTFHWENEMLIDDIAIKSGNSIRRSTMLELCTKMASETFTRDLLDSSLAQQFLKNVGSNGEIVFDFIVAVATTFMLQSNPTSAVLDEIIHSQARDTLVMLLSNDVDIHKIAKLRKTNLSKIAQESVVAFRSVVLGSPVWSKSKPETLSPQLVALKSLDLLVLGVRKTGCVGSIFTHDIISKLVEVASTTAERLKGDYGSGGDDRLILDLTFSILEALSLAPSKQTLWPSHTLIRLANLMPTAIELGDTAVTTLAVKLCMNLTNNKPKACQHFSDAAFVQSLVQSIVDRFKLLEIDSDEAQWTKTLDTLILSLGAMINLTEHSNEARVNIDDNHLLIETLVKTFVAGSVRTAQAISMEETQASVAIGYLSVLLGNMCLNDSIKSMVRAQLPGRQLNTLVDKIKEFVQVHEHANRKAKHFEGEEGQDTWRNYTARIMLVVEELERVGC